MGHRESGLELSEPAESPERGSARSIATRLVRRTLLAVGLPLLAISGLVAGTGYWLAQRAQDRVEASQAALAGDTVGQLKVDQSQLMLARIDDFLRRSIDDLVTLSRAPGIVEGAGAAYPQVSSITSQTVESVQSQRKGDEQLDTSLRSARALQSAADINPAFALLVLTESHGFNVGVTKPASTFVHRNESWWAAALTNGAAIGAAQIDPATGARSIPMAVRVDNPTSGAPPLGVIEAMVDLAAVQDLANQSANRKVGLETVLTTSKGQLLAETASGHDPARILSDTTFVAGRDQASGQILSTGAETGFLALPGTVSGYSRLAPTRSIPALGISVANPPWVAVVDQPTSQALAPSGGLSALTDETRQAVRWVIVATAVAALIGLVLAWLLARRLSRRLTRPLADLQAGALRLADHDLPALLRSDLSPERRPGSIQPLTVEGDREVAGLASAFNTVRSAAVELAANQAIDRNREVASVLVNLGRRNQQLIGRQLRFIDDLERSESNPDTLRNLFTLDQMATRMRRNAESLLVLAGEDSPRRGTQPRPIDEVIRAATSEVEDFARVSIRMVDTALVQPRVISDLTHLLAELIENATLFSPPETTVDVTGALEPTGTYTISIVDHGLGLPADRLEEANQRIATAAAPGTPSSSFLGLFVVGRLAARHEIRARLADSASTGLTARVTLPAACLAAAPEPAGDVRGSRLHVSGPLPALSARHSGPPPARRPRPPAKPQPVGREQRLPPARPQPPRPQPSPAEAADTGSAMSAAEAEDETAGLPIPPFRSRASRRIDGGEAATVPGDDGDEENRRFQVRRRVRKTPSGSGAGIGAEVTAGGSDDSGLARAVEVRDKLNRFTSGVEAAKARRPAPDQTPPAEVDDDQADADQPDADQAEIDRLRNGNGNGNGNGATEHSELVEPLPGDARSEPTLDKEGI